MEAVLTQFGGVDPNLQKHFPLFGKEQSPCITLNDLPLYRARITGKVLPLISDVAIYWHLWDARIYAITVIYICYVIR